MNNSLTSISANSGSSNNILDASSISDEKGFCQASITSKHFQELLASGIDPDIARLNFKSLEGEITHEYLLSEAIAKLGAGKLVPHSDQYVTNDIKKYYKQYQHTLAGGWWCSGLDPLDNFSPMEWGCFKPNQPRQNQKGKSIKYEHPPGTSTRAFFLRVPRNVWQIVSDRVGIPIGDYTEFWAWIADHDIPITLTEGAKKSAALLSCGIVAIGLPGINSGYRKLEDAGRFLIPDLVEFTKIPRKFIICFDSDSKIKTRANVERATNTLGKLLKHSIKGKNQVYVATWLYPEKGIDDVLVTYGSDTIDSIFDNAIALSRYNCQRYYRISKNITKPINKEYLGDILQGINHRIVAVKSPKGTGKTESLINQVMRLVNAGYKVFLASHRIQLCQEICRRLNIPYIDDLRNKGNGYGFVIDSFHDRGKCQSDIENDYTFLTDDYVVIIDEIEQFLWHLFDSATEVRKHRCEVIKQFELLIKNANQIYILDADLTDVSIDYIKSISDFDNDDIFIINNDYKSNGYKAFIYQSPEDVISAMLSAIENDKKVLACTDGQKLKSKYSTQNMEKLIRKKYPDKKILIVDSHTIADPNNIAYGCVTKLNSMINQFDVVLCSPTIGTGISIDIKGYFDAVYGIFQGVQGENAVRQQLMRLRDNCDRHLYISKSGMNFAGDGSTSLYMLSDCQYKQFKNHLQMLRNNGFELDENGINSNDKALNCYLKMACRINNEMSEYDKIILENLALEGNKIIILGEEDNDDLKAEIKLNKDINYREEREQIALIDIDDLDDNSYEQLANQKAKTIVDKHREKKYSIKKRYQVDDITPDLILFDDDGSYPQLKLHYYLTLGNQFLSDKDKKNAESIKNSNMVFLPDFNRSQLGVKVGILKSLGIDKFIERSQHEIFHNESQIIVDIANKARTSLNAISKHIGKLSPDMTNINLVKKLLKSTGYTFKVASRLTRNINGIKERYYTYNCVSIDGGTVDRELIFSKWYQSDTVQSEKLYQVMIQNSENQSDFSNINNLKNSDLENTALNHQNKEIDNPPQNCFVLDGLTGAWVGAVLKTEAFLSNGTYKALVVLWNGLKRYIWSPAHISIC